MDVADPTDENALTSYVKNAQIICRNDNFLASIKLYTIISLARLCHNVVSK